MTDTYEEVVRAVLNGVAELLDASGYEKKEVSAWFDASWSRKPTGAESAARSRLDSDHVRLYSAMLTAWHTDPPYLDRDGEPLSIPLDGDSPSIQCLAASAMKRESLSALHLSADDILHTLVAHRVVEATSQKRVRAIKREFPLNTPMTTSPHQMLTDLRDFIENLKRHLHEPGNADFQAVATCYDFPKKLVPIASANLTGRAIELIRELDEYLDAQKSYAGDTVDGRVRMGVGIYVILAT